jgi:Ca2+-binding RTX toxin-like protein
MALTAATTNGNDFITVTAAQLPGAVLDGLGGNDTLSLSGGGDFYLTRVMNGWGNNAAPARFVNFETVQGSAALDRIYLDAAQLQSLSLVDGGAGDRNFLFLTGTAIDTRNVSFANITGIVLYDSNATVTVDELSVAMLLDAKATKNDHLIVRGFTLTDAEFRMLHSQGFDRVTDATGRTSVDNAPTMSGVDTAAREIRNGQAVSLDPAGAIKLADDFGPIREIRIENASIESAAGTFAIANTDRVKVFGSFGRLTVTVDGTEVGYTSPAAGGLSVQFYGSVTQDVISAVLKAITVDLQEHMFSDNDIEFIKFTAADDGGRTTSAYMQFYKVFDENGRGTTGGPKADILIGDGGRDVIWGRGGDDILYGKGGKDMLVGFAGKDTFVFDTKPSKAAMDTISDFSVKSDSIWLDNAVFKKLGKAGTKTKPAQLKKDFFVTGSEAKDKNDYLVYDKKKGLLSYDADGSGTVFKPVEIATLRIKASLIYKDFFVI